MWLLVNPLKIDMYKYTCGNKKKAIGRRLERGKMTTARQPGIEPGTSHFQDDPFACLVDRAAWLGGYTSMHNSQVTS